MQNSVILNVWLFFSLNHIFEATLMKYTIHPVKLEAEFKICPLCGYTDGFHTMLKRVDGEIRSLYICPACHEIFDVKEKL